MATNPFLAQLMQRIGPQMQRMPQLNQQWAGMRPPMQGLFGGGQPFQPRRANLAGGQMPRLDPAQFMSALRGLPGFIPPPSPGTPQPAAPAITPAAPATRADLLANPNNPISPLTGYIQGQPLNEAQMLTNSGGGMFWNPMWNSGSPGDMGA